MDAIQAIQNLNYSYIIHLLDKRLNELKQEKITSKLTTCVFDCKKNNIDVINKEINFIKKEMKKLLIIHQHSNKLSDAGDTDELLDLDYTIAQFVLPRLINFKKLMLNKQAVHSYPKDLKDMNEWINILDKMIYAFKILKNELTKNNMKNYDKYIEGINLFAKYFNNLWD